MPRRRATSSASSPRGRSPARALLQPFQRGMQRILKGRTGPDHPGPPRPGHGEHLQPGPRQPAPRADPAAGDRLVRRPRCRPDTPLPAVRRAIHDLDQEAWAHRKADRRPLHHAFIRRARRHPVPARLRRRRDAPASRGSGPWPGRSPWPARCGRSWEGQPHVGILLPSSVAAALVNLAASLAGRASVNLNFTAGRAGMESAARQAGLRTVVTSRAFLEKAKLELPGGRRADLARGPRRGDRRPGSG